MQGWINRANNEAHYNMAASLDAGLMIPDVEFLRTLSEDRQQEFYNDPEWELVPDAAMFRKKVPGLDVGFHTYYAPGELACKMASVVDSRLLSGNIGPEIGDCAMTIFPGYNEKIDVAIGKLIEKALSHEPDFWGFVSVFGVFTEKGEFICKTISYGYNVKFLTTVMRLYDADYRIFFKPEGMDVRHSIPAGYGVSLRVYNHPYTMSGNQEINHPGLEWDGSSFVAAARGNKVKVAWQNLYVTLEGIQENACFPNYCDIRARRIINDLLRRQYVKRILPRNSSTIDPGADVRGGDADEQVRVSAGTEAGQADGDQIQDRVSELPDAPSSGSD